MFLEVLIPVRNPTEVLAKTIDSLAAQTDKNFSILISDNFSTSGAEQIERALKKLSAAGIAVHKIQPPQELGRVEHWNWLHHRSTADWLKPLFAGDWLEPDYVECVRNASLLCPQVDIINCSFTAHHADGTKSEAVYSGGFHPPKEVLSEAFTKGNCLGGPINICFKRLAFDLVGGYPPALPVSADFWLILMLAMRNGIWTCPNVLGHFNYHPARFSTNFPWTKIHGDRELFIILLAATSTANFMELPVDLPQRNRFFARLLKRNVKAWIHRWWKSDHRPH